MEPSEIATHLPAWVIPEGTDLAQLRVSTDQLIAEFSRPIHSSRLSSSWSYLSEGNFDRGKWIYPHHVVPRIYICSTADQLREVFAFTQVMEATVPYGSWVVEDSLLHNVFSAREIFKLSVKTRRAIRLEWLKQLKEKIGGC